MRYIEIFEAISDKLYHTTCVDHLYEILEEDEIKANTGHPITHTGGEKRSRHWGFRPSDVSSNGYIKGVSLTRSLSFARKWKSRSWKISADGVILVLDGSLIKRDFRSMPISFWGGSMRHEAEEFVFGPIKPLSKYLLYVEANQNTAELNDLASNFKYFEHPTKLVVRH